jgi:hypothetical protein
MTGAATPLIRAAFRNVAPPIQLVKSAIGPENHQNGPRETTRMRIVGIVMFAAALSCTPGLAQTSPPNASANAYREFTCLQLAQEGRAVSKRGFAASGLPAGQGGSDSTELAPAIVIVWPVSSNVDDKQRSDKIAFANHEMDALEQASIAGQCSIRFQRPPTKG